MDNRPLAQRIREHLDTLAQFTATPGEGVTRFPFTKEARDASLYLQQQMESLGLQVRMDNSGSVIGRLEGQVSDTIMLGSHLDSVQNGGAYDGIAGVVCGLEALRLYQQQGQKPYYSMEVIATNDEEGSRFQSGLFTGKVLAGQLSVEDIQRLQDREGISVYQAMKDYGLQPEEIAQHTREDIKAFLEIHIEQGPVLEAAEKEIGIVDTIVGIRRLRVVIKGRADHIGTMPMNMRMDALEAAAKVIAPIGDRARQYPLAVATVGHLQVEPNIINIVPEQVTFFVDMRGTTEAMIQAQYQGLQEDLAAVAQKLHVEYEIQEVLYVAPVNMDEKIKSYFQESCQRQGFSHMSMVSGAGHDAQVFGERMPVAMLFVPSIGGRSHCPEENSDPAVLAKACQVAVEALVRLQEEKSL